MPAVLTSAQFDDWLNVRDVNAETAAAMLAPAPDSAFQIEDIAAAPKPTRRKPTEQAPPSSDADNQGKLF